MRHLKTGNTPHGTVRVSEVSEVTQCMRLVRLGAFPMIPLAQFDMNGWTCPVVVRAPLYVLVRACQLGVL